MILTVSIAAGAVRCNVSSRARSFYMRNICKTCVR